jgi:hypothetical protein
LAGFAGKSVIQTGPAQESPPGESCAHAVISLATSEDGDRAQAWWACRDCGAPFAPVARARAPHSTKLSNVASAHPNGTEYLSIRDLARRIPYAEGSIRNLISRRSFRLGEHYLKPHGRVVFKWPAVQAWLEQQRRGA